MVLLGLRDTDNDGKADIIAAPAVGGYKDEGGLPVGMMIR